jgi:CheY-like chemotaxis protein
MALVREQLLLGAADGGRIACSGPEIVLAPQMALHLAMVLHELGTNARKHGALSVPEGRLAVSWAVEANGSRVLRLRWVETGGPPVRVSGTPGFGTVLIEQSVKAHGGRTRMLSEANGISWDIDLPLPELAAADGCQPGHAEPTLDVAPSPHRDAQAGAAGRRVLVIEDEPLLALEIAGSLAEAGIEVLGPAATVEEAVRLIESTPLDGALLDANLHGHPVDEVAAALARRKVRFAFVTGYGRQSLPRAFRGAPVITKPFDPRQLLDATREITSSGSGNVVPLRDRTGTS